jgi:hypothetical protein
VASWVISALSVRNLFSACALIGVSIKHWRGVDHMGRGILLWLLGVPIPIIILLALFMR